MSNKDNGIFARLVNSLLSGDSAGPDWVKTMDEVSGTTDTDGTDESDDDTTNTDTDTDTDTGTDSSAFSLLMDWLSRNDTDDYRSDHVRKNVEQNENNTSERDNEKRIRPQTGFYPGIGEANTANTVDSIEMTPTENEREKQVEYADVDVFDEVPSEYEQLIYESADPFIRISNQFGSMSPERSKACLESVIDRINKYEGISPVIDALSDNLNTSTLDVDESVYHIGLKTENYAIVDAEVVGVSQSPPHTDEILPSWVHPDLPDFDHEISIYTHNNVIYSRAFNDIRSLTPESLALHLASRGEAYNRMFKNDKEKFDDVNFRVRFISSVHDAEY